MILVVYRVIVCRAVRNRTQKGSLRQIKIRKLTVKIAMARCLNTIISVHEIDIIQVELHNIVLGIFLFQLHRYEHFLDFSLPVLVCIQINISGELHRDGTATLGNSLVLYDGLCGTHYCL